MNTRMGRSSQNTKHKSQAKGSKPSSKPKKVNNNKRKRPETKKSNFVSKRQKIDDQARPPPRPEESDDDLLPEDEKFFLEHGEYLSILDNMPTENQKKPRRKREDTNHEEKYEQLGARRNREWEEKKKPTKLPVLVGSKMVAPPPAGEHDSDGSDADDDEASIQDQEEEDEPLGDGEGMSSFSDNSDDEVEVLPDEVGYPEDDGAADLAPEELELRVFIQRQEKIAEAKQQIAILASSVLEDPEENLSKLKELHKLCNNEDSTVRKLAILSELAVLKDIIPSYRIIAEEEDQSGVVLSKEVKKVREFELGLLKAYQRYLRTLEDVIKKALERGKANRKTMKQEKQLLQQAGEEAVDPLLQHKLIMGVAAAAVKALGELLSTQYHFNFRANLIAALVPVMDCRHEELSSVACHYMSALFKNDSKGSCSLEAVRAIFQLIKARQYSVRPEILLTFLSLPLSTEMGDDVDIFDQKRQQSSKKHLSKKQKKARKEQKALDKEMQQAAAEQSREEKIRIQTETLKALFLLYFKVLKNLQKSPLLAPVLEGLSRFAHLINMDLLTNLLELLKDLVSKNKLSLASSLHCIVTAFQTFKLQGETLEVDLKDFYAHFYKIMPEVFSSVSLHRELMPLTLRALDLMLTNKRLFAIDRTAAYIKRLLMMSLHASPNIIMAILKIVYDLLRVRRTGLPSRGLH
eukprot:TRINITY_DN5016_c0_g1_i3.p1 TRINITY_DN5016_c0_g1~~TRINITY_DN5016_c0_g1_i3.p1  ORF type:complete len:691 (-),score=154.31 TRINITY_DN5016_c0_g1_i3:2309-4381(-)